MNEHGEQSAVIEWAAMMANQYPALRNIFSIPNAGKRSIGAARFYRAEGLKAGIPQSILDPGITIFSGNLINIDRCF